MALTTSTNYVIYVYWLSICLSQYAGNLIIRVETTSNLCNTVCIKERILLVYRHPFSEILFFQWVWTSLKGVCVCVCVCVWMYVIKRNWENFYYRYYKQKENFMGNILTAKHINFNLVYFATAKSFQSCPTLWDPMDCSPPGSSGQRIFQARILDWVAISSSWRFSRPRD